MTALTGREEVEFNSWNNYISTKNSATKITPASNKNEWDKDKSITFLLQKNITHTKQHKTAKDNYKILKKNIIIAVITFQNLWYDIYSTLTTLVPMYKLYHYNR